MLFVFKGKEGILRNYYLKENQRKNLNHASSPASALLFRSIRSIWSLSELQTFSFADTGAFRGGFKIMKMIHLNVSIRKNIMVSL